MDFKALLLREPLKTLGTFPRFFATVCLLMSSHVGSDRERFITDGTLVGPDAVVNTHVHWNMAKHFYIDF